VGLTRTLVGIGSLLSRRMLTRGSTIHPDGRFPVGTGRVQDEILSHWRGNVRRQEPGQRIQRQLPGLGIETSPQVRVPIWVTSSLLVPTNNPRVSPKLTRSLQVLRRAGTRTTMLPKPIGAKGVYSTSGSRSPRTIEGRALRCDPL
jgi:hypothetical protein